MIILLEDRHYAIAGKDRATDIGQAIDAAIKEQIIELGGIPSDQYAPHDYLLNDTYHEIKSSAGTWVSIPNSEYEFAVDLMKREEHVIYVILEQCDLHRARLIGSILFEDLYQFIEPSKFLTWRKTPEGWKQERSHRVLLSKIKPLLL